MNFNNQNNKINNNYKLKITNIPKIKIKKFLMKLMK